MRFSIILKLPGTLLYLLIISWALTACQESIDLIADEGTHYCDDIERNDSLSIDGLLRQYKDSMVSKTGVYVLEDGSGSMINRAWFSEYAKESINIQYFIFSTDNIGLIACDYLVRAADRGVKVNILVDDIMVNTGIQDILTLNSHPNIAVKIYNPGLNLGKNIFEKIKKIATEFRSANQRMHNKTFIVDNQIAITGGRNIADEYFDYDHEYNFRDRDVLLLGKSSRDINQSFNKFWEDSLSIPVTELNTEQALNVTHPDRFVRLHEYACNPNNFWPQVRKRLLHFPEDFSKLLEQESIVWIDSVQFVSDRPGKNDGRSGLGGGGLTTSTLSQLVEGAKQSIDIQTPYLITTTASRELFRKAVNRGVKIRILTNSLSSTDNVEAFSSYQSDREKLLETGVEIFEFKPNAEVRKLIMTGEVQATLEHSPIFGLHAKSMVVDGKLAVIGTFNLDPRSANLNTECIVIIPSRKIAKSVAEGMEIEFQPENSWRITSNFNPDSEVSRSKRLKTWTRKVLPQDIL